MKHRNVIAALSGVLFTSSLLVAAYLFVWKPHIVLQEARTLPPVPRAVSAQKMGLLGADFGCLDLKPVKDIAMVETTAAALRRRVRTSPNDVCAGNQYRQAIKYLAILQNHFAISVNSLPEDLIPLVGGSASSGAQLPLTEDAPEQARSEQTEPVALFLPLHIQTRSEQTALQLGLSYVDLMIHEGGRERKARLSSHSIELLSNAIQLNPYLVGALYGRGLNYLYWPAIAGKLPLAIGDLKACVALSRLSTSPSPPPRIFAESYTALGDSYTKLADITPSSIQKRALFDAARYWWSQGLIHFPHYGALEARLSKNDSDIVYYVDAARGLETYINTDLNLLWKN